MNFPVTELLNFSKVIPLRIPGSFSSSSWRSEIANLLAIDSAHLTAITALPTIRLCRQREL
jgi:hypothetical protein